MFLTENMKFYQCIWKETIETSVSCTVDIIELQNILTLLDQWLTSMDFIDVIRLNFYCKVKFEFESDRVKH